MEWHKYDHIDPVIVVEDDQVYVKVRGYVNWKSGDHMNEANETKRFEISEEEILDAADEIENRD